MKTRLSFIAGFGSSALPVLSKVLEEESKKLDFDYLAVSDSTSEKDCKEILESDVVFLYASNLPEKTERAIAGSKAKIVVSASEYYAQLSKGSLDVLNKATAYFKTGGERNLRNLVRFLLKSFGMDVQVDEVSELPWHGIYHPKLGSFREREEYLRVYKRKPLVGLLFYRTYWLYGNLKHFNAVIESLESEGLGVLPVFTHGFRDERLDTPSTKDTIKEFFADGNPVDAVFNLTAFHLFERGKTAESELEGVNLLEELNVPIIQPCSSFHQSVSEWEENPQGLDYLSQVYSIVMPETDGLIEPVFLVGSRIDDSGVKSYEPYKEHAEYLARRIKKWIELRKKKPEDRRIAIVLINPPCKGLEANVAVGGGLDVPESIARLLKQLKGSGYNIENLPEDGKELIRTILERKALSEFRWTSVEEIVGKGGAADFIDLNSYIGWFNELPEKARSQMLKEWGKPEEVLAGKVDKEFVGMVYEQKFVVPGLKFGDFFITPQPKFGCAGARCDGKVCKILHNPTIPPPHQWLAVYRWITRVFKADIILHFGTHGYLEFRPGKGIGLSTSCWPEISIDDAPHGYVYNVSNPMEGVIAKRRGYAAIVDHVYPPMAMADVLEDVNDLLTQYSKAKGLGEFERAEIIYNDLIEKAKANNIPIRGEEPEKVVENIHSYIDSVRGTQIEQGLHIFAHPRTDKLAEHVATVMAYDSNEFPSIRRMLAGYIGLDYDEVRNNPKGVNRMELTNSETMDLLHKVAVNVFQELLNLEDGKDEEIQDVIAKKLSEFFGR